MYNLEIDLTEYQNERAGYYERLAKQLRSLLSIEPNAVTNMAQTAAFIFTSIPDLNWAGFYVNDGNDQLRLGPYQGRVACVHIPFGRGVCGTVAAKRQSLLINNVHEFEGHIACDSASNSEIVVPLIQNDKVLGVLDIDSPTLNRFHQEDLDGFEALAAEFLAATQW
ncbi:MAG: GAF domain-containing protein [Gammaproteobacteria bacterium]|nr:GAF domain-containing protein [Gammaproteobacteria bacterium]